MPISPLRARIEKKLSERLKPVFLSVDDFSHKHEGHQSDLSGVESHFQIKVVSDVFRTLTKIERQRLIYSILSDEMKQKIHALSLSTLTPEETEAIDYPDSR